MGFHLFRSSRGKSDDKDDESLSGYDEYGMTNDKQWTKPGQKVPPGSADGTGALPGDVVVLAAHKPGAGVDAEGPLRRAPQSQRAAAAVQAEVSTGLAGQRTESD
ncbi:hypothetical protein E4U42_004853, partial [Claviceps africana]